MSINSKSKGNRFENQIAKTLSLWLTNQQRSDVLERAPSSGAKATIAYKTGQDKKNIVGDIIGCGAEGFEFTNKFMIELKFQNEKNLALINLLYQTANKSGIYLYWWKLVIECQRINKYPMLIFKQNAKPIFIIFDQRGIAFFDCLCYTRFWVKHEKADLFILTLDDFLKNVRPDKLISQGEK